MAEKKRPLNEEDEVNALLKAHEAIANELIYDAILELCFEIHKKAKFTQPFTEETQNNSKSVKSAKSQSILCFACGNNKGANKFTTHLFDCMNAQSRKAKSKIINFKEPDSEEEAYFDDDDPALKKAKTVKKSQRGKTKLGNSVSKTTFSNSPSFIDNLSCDDKKAFFNQRCGVVSRRTKKMCMNSTKCASHTDIERENVRITHQLLSKEMDEELDNEQIDIDNVDVEIMPSETEFSESLPSLSAYNSGSSSYF